MDLKNKTYILYITQNELNIEKDILYNNSNNRL